MPLLRRRARMPDDVRVRLHLERGDRILATALLTDGWAAATTRALHVAIDGEEPVHHAWSDVDAGRLDPEAAELTIAWVDGSPSTVLHLADNRSVNLPRAVHERVQSSVVHTEKVTLPSGSIVRVAVRRAAGGGLITQVLGSGDVNLDDPATAAAVDAAEARVREAVGLH